MRQGADKILAAGVKDASRGLGRRLGPG